MTLFKTNFNKKLDKYIKEHYIPPYSEEIQADRCELTEFGKTEKRPMFAAAMPCGAAPKKRQLEDVLEQVSISFSKRLFQLIDEKALTNAEVYKKAGIDRKLFSKIQCNEDYRPAKKTAFALALALELNLDETKDLLARAGYAISPSSVFDLIIQFFIENGVYDIYAVNEALYEHNEQVLV